MRIGLLAALALAIFAVLFLRLWALQVLSGTDYLRAAQNNQLRTIRLEAPRGSILDREGRILVQNRQETVVRVWPADLPKRGAYQELRELARILRVPLAAITRDVERRRGDPVTPVIVASGVNERIVDYLTERRRDFPGVEVHETYMREYPRGLLASHLLGYVAEISQDQLDRRRSGSFRPGDRIGQAGVEAAFDPYLRGRSGLAELRVDSLGQPRSSILETESPTPGQLRAHDARPRRPARGRAFADRLDRERPSPGLLRLLVGQRRRDRRAGPARRRHPRPRLVPALRPPALHGPRRPA